MFAAARAALHRLSASRNTVIFPAAKLRPFSNTSRNWARFESYPKGNYQWQQYSQYQSLRRRLFGPGDFRIKAAAVATGAGGVYFVYHLEKMPETGRWRFMDISARQEEQLAVTAHRELIEEYGGQLLPPSTPLYRSVSSIVQELLESNSLGSLRDITSHQDTLEFDREHSKSRKGKETKWNLLVVNDPKTVNAMATWGTIVLFTGLLPVTQTKDGLAAVLGHEIAHATLRHSSENLSAMKVLTALTLVLSAAGIDMDLAQIGYKLAINLPNSRKKELEADKVGMLYAARACFDPRAAGIVQTRLGELSKSGNSPWTGFLNTHPPGDQRTKRLEESLPEAYEVQAASPKCASTAESYFAFRDALGSGSSIVSDRGFW